MYVYMCVIMSLRNARSYTYRVSLKWLPKYQMNKDTYTHTSMEQGKLRVCLPCIKNYRKLKHAENGRTNLPWARLHQLFISTNWSVLKTHVYK